MPHGREEQPQAGREQRGGPGGADLYFGHRTKLPHPISHLRRLGEELTCGTATGGQAQGTVSRGGPCPINSHPQPGPSRRGVWYPLAACCGAGWEWREEWVVNPNHPHWSILSTGVCLAGLPRANKGPWHCGWPWRGAIEPPYQSAVTVGAAIQVLHEALTHRSVPSTKGMKMDKDGDG